MVNEIRSEGGQAFIQTEEGCWNPLKISGSIGSVKGSDFNQKTLIHYISSCPHIPLVVCLGRAGTGKSFITLASCLDLLTEGRDYQKMIFTKPLVSVSRSKFLGTLPGTLDEKVAPFVESIFDVAEAMEKVSTVEQLFKERVIEFVPLDFMRGRSFENALVVCDEVQNLDRHELMTLVSRLGKHSRMILLGDPSPLQRDSDSGAQPAILELVNSGKFHASPLTAFVRLNKMMRSPVIELVEDVLFSPSQESSEHATQERIRILADSH